MNLKAVYLVLAVAGAVIPYAFFLQHFASAGIGIADFLGSAFANGVASGFAADLIIASVVFWIAMIHHRKKKDGPSPSLFVLLNLCIGLSCALPAWLYACESRQKK